MPPKTYNLSTELLAAIDSLRVENATYESIFRKLLGMPQIQPKTSDVVADPDYQALASLIPGQGVLLLFVRDEPVRNADGEIPVNVDYRPKNLRHLAQVVRRVQERLGYKLYVEGRPRGQWVQRIS